MKVVKIAVKVLVCLVILALVAVLAMPVWFGPVVKTAANAAVPGVVKTDFRMGHLSLNPYTARFELGDLNLGNPSGYAVNDAVKVGSVTFDADTFSLMTDVIHIEEITIRDLFVSIVTGGKHNVMNFKQIQYNVAGGKEKYEAAQSEKEAQKASTADNPASAKEFGSGRPAKKVIIDRLEVSGLTLQLGILPIRIPSVVLTDIGRQSGGVTLEQAWQQILDGVMKSAGVVGDRLKALGALPGDAVKKANEGIGKATTQAAAAVNDANRQISASTQKATESVNSVVGSATDAVNGGTKAVNEGAKKAAEALKSLW